MKRRQLTAFFSLLTVLFILALYLVNRDKSTLTDWFAVPSPSLVVLPVPSANPTQLPMYSPASSPVTSSSSAFYSVAKVVDGDTIKVVIDGKSETVRLVGINAPESVDPRKPVECMGKEASQYLTSKLANQTVRLEPDPTQSDRDRYGRLLRFVFLPDGTDVGLELIVAGYAQEAMYSTKPHQYRESYLEAQQMAQGANQGLWNPLNCGQE